MRLQHLHPIRALVLVVLLAVAACAVTTSVASAKRHKKPDSGAVYTETNDPTANAVIAFDRKANGKLKQRQVIPTGGQGGLQTQPGCDPPGGCPILDTDGEVIVTKNGKNVFAVNAGSNTVSSFRRTSKGKLKLVEQESSAGVFPESLTVHGNLLYVLNNNSADIYGYRFTSAGNMTPIAGSLQPLSVPGPANALPRQIGFDRTGKMLVVTILGAGLIDTFVMNSDGTPKPATAPPASSTNPLPFGFAFDPSNRLVLSEVTSMTAPGNTSTYGVTPGTGAVTPIDSEGSQGAAPCWVEITGNGKYVFVVNTGGGMPPATITRYKLAADGTLTFLGLTDERPGEFARTDESLSRNSKFLYVLAPSVIAGDTSHIDSYRVSSKGGLKFIGSTPSKLPVGVSGLAAR